MMGGVVGALALVGVPLTYWIYRRQAKYQFEDRARADAVRLAERELPLYAQVVAQLEKVNVLQIACRAIRRWIRPELEQLELAPRAMSSGAGGPRRH